MDSGLYLCSGLDNRNGCPFLCQKLIYFERDRMSDVSKKSVKGWQIVLIAAALYIVSAILGGVLGKSINAAASIAVLIGIVVGIVNLVKAKKFSKNDIIGTIVSVVAIIIALSITGSVGSV